MYSRKETIMAKDSDSLGGAIGEALFYTFKATFKTATVVVNEATKLGKEALEYVDDNQEEIKDFGKEALTHSKTFLTSSLASSVEAAKDIYTDVTYTSEEIEKLEMEIQQQGMEYRSICNNFSGLDTLLVGTESLASLIESESVPTEIIDAYALAFPNMSRTISFEDKALELEEDQITGFVAAVKGKLFEMNYVDYLNEGQLPDGYSASLAGSPTQQGWDIAVRGPDGNTVDLIQAKATDSVSYVKQAIVENPHIDVVTTEEVYSQLLMSGANDQLINSGIANDSLELAVEGAVSSSELSMNLTPPIFSLAFIAFTSYSEENLSLYEKSKIAGERSGRTYLSYLIGGGVSVLTGTWWLGLAGTVASHYFSDSGAKITATLNQLQAIKNKNVKVLNELRHKEGMSIIEN
jgi:hypothetical protein